MSAGSLIQAEVMSKSHGTQGWVGEALVVVTVEPGNIPQAQRHSQSLHGLRSRVIRLFSRSGLQGGKHSGWRCPSRETALNHGYQLVTQLFPSMVVGCHQLVFVICSGWVCSTVNGLVGRCRQCLG